MPITSQMNNVITGQNKTSQLSNNQQLSKQIPNWKATLLERKRYKSEYPQWKLEMIKRKRENAPGNNIDIYDNLSRKFYHSSVPCLSTFQDEHIYEDVDERIIPISSNPIVLLDQEKRRSLNLEEKNNLMLKKLSYEICRENILDGEMEYGKGFVGKLLKKFNSLLNISCSDKFVVKIISEGGNDIVAKNNSRKEIKERKDRVKNEGSSPTLKGSSLIRVENKTINNNGLPAIITSRESFDKAECIVKGADSLLSSNEHARSIGGIQNSSCKKDKHIQDSVVFSEVDKSDLNDGDNFYEEISSYGVVIRSSRESEQLHEEVEELPRQNQVKETKSVFENFVVRNLLDPQAGNNMKSLGRLGTNSKYYGRQDVKKPSDVKNEIPSKNLPDILLSNSPRSDMSTSNKIKDSDFAQTNSNNKNKFYIKKNSETKENSETKTSSNDKSVARELNFVTSGNALTPSNSSNSTCQMSSTIKSNKPGSLVVRSSSNTPSIVQDLRPYKDVRVSSSIQSRNTKMSENDKINLLQSSAFVASENSKVGIFGPESFVTLGDGNIPVTNIDADIKIGNSFKNETKKIVVNGYQADTKATVKFERSSPWDISTESIRMKALLLDSPRSSDGSTNEDGAELKEEEPVETNEGDVAFLGEGVIHKKSALTKSKKGTKKKMSVTFLDPEAEAQIFEYEAEDVEDENFNKSSLNNCSHLSNYKSKMHVDFKLGSSNQREDYDFRTNQNEDYEFRTNQETSEADDQVSMAPAISTPWSSNISLDLMF